MKVIHNDVIKEIPTMPNKNGVDVIFHEIAAEGHQTEEIEKGPNGKKESVFVLDDEAFAKWSAKAKAEINNPTPSTSEEDIPGPYNMKQAMKLSGDSNLENIVEKIKEYSYEKKSKGKKKKEEPDKYAFGDKKPKKDEKDEKPFDFSIHTPLLENTIPEPPRVSHLTTEDYERLQRQQELPPLDMNMEDIGITKSTIEEIAGRYGYNMEAGISVFAIPITLPIIMTEKLMAKANLMAETAKLKISDYFIQLMLKDIMEKEGGK